MSLPVRRPDKASDRVQGKILKLCGILKANCAGTNLTCAVNCVGFCNDFFVFKQNRLDRCSARRKVFRVYS